MDYLPEIPENNANPRQPNTRCARIGVRTVSARMGKSKDTGAEEEIAKETKLCPIAKPLADEKLKKKLLKLTKKAAKKKQVKRGVKEVVKALRKNVKG